MDVIVGGGKYGCIAIELLRQKRRDFIVVDIDPGCQAAKLFGLEPSDTIPLQGEHLILGGLSNVVRVIEAAKPEFVFPTAPVHIVSDMAKTKFALTPWLDAVDCMLPKLPQSVVLRAGKSEIILSYNRDYECVDKCSMPETCPISRIKKPCTMTQLMKYANPDAYVLISHSMAPGIGALKGAEILAFFNSIKTKKRFVVGTACDCHGVFSAFEKF